MNTRSRRKEARPREIIEAAFKIFVRDGFAGTRLDDIAALAEVTKGTIYVYFESKESLFAAMIRELSGPAFKGVVVPVRADMPYRDQLRQHILRVYELLVDGAYMKEILRLLIAEAPRFPDLFDEHFQEFVEPAITNIKRIVEAGVEAGEFKPSAVTRCQEILIAPALAYAIMTLVFARQMPIDGKGYVDAHIHMVLVALSID